MQNTDFFDRCKSKREKQKFESMNFEEIPKKNTFGLLPLASINREFIKIFFFYCWYDIFCQTFGGKLYTEKHEWDYYVEINYRSCKIILKQCFLQKPIRRML